MTLEEGSVDVDMFHAKVKRAMTWRIGQIHLLGIIHLLTMDALWQAHDLNINWVLQALKAFLQCVKRSEIAASQPHSFMYK